MTMSTLYIFNTTIITTPGLTYTSEVITAEVARRIIKHHRGPVVSAVGHQSTAEIASMLLEHDVPVSRIAAEQGPGDRAICLKLRGRAPEGVILDRGQVEAIGYDFVLLTAAAPGDRNAFVDKMMCVAHLLTHPDDAAPTVAEHTPGTRRVGGAPMQAHFIVRRPAAHDGTFVEVSQEWGTDAWDIRELSAEQAREQCAVQRGPHGALRDALRNRVERLIADVLQPGHDDRRARGPAEVQRDVYEAFESYILHPDLPLGDDEVVLRRPLTDAEADRMSAQLLIDQGP